MDSRELLAQIIFLLAAPQAGEPGRLRQVLEKELLAHHHYLLAVLGYKTRDPGLAEELLQETYLSFLTIAHKKEFLPEGQKLRNYLLTIALNKLRDHARSGSRQAARMTRFATPEDFEAWMENLADPGPDPAEAFARAQEEEWRRQAVALAMERLPERQREILELRFARDLDNQALADRLGLGIKAVESLLFRARAGFRKELEKIGLDEPLMAARGGSGSPGRKTRQEDGKPDSPANGSGSGDVDSMKGSGNGGQGL